MPLDAARDLVHAFAGPDTVLVQYGADRVGGILNAEDVEMPDATGVDRVVLAGTLLWIQQGALPTLEAAFAAGQEPILQVDGTAFRARSPRRQSAGAYLQVFLIRAEG